MVYDYRCDVCKETWEAEFSMADRDAPVGDTCLFCDAPVGSVERWLPWTNGLNYSGSDGKTPDAFKDVLRNMKSKHRHSTINPDGNG